MHLRRKINQPLPEQLRVPGSDLDVLITEINQPGTENRIGFKSAIRAVRHTVAGLCPQYKPSQAHENDCLCASGETSGTPFRGEKCFGCRVSQFSASGFFTGEVVGHRPTA